MSGRRAIFLDRDGTLMEEVSYCSDPAQVKVYPGVPDALRGLKEAGFLLLIVTNQSGIGRGRFTEAQYSAVQAELLRQLGDSLIDASYFCPDAPDAASSRRTRPEPGMLLEAAAEYAIDLPRSFMIGDKSSDVECGRRRLRTVQVMTGYGREQICASDYQAENLVKAAAIILHLK